MENYQPFKDDSPALRTLAAANRDGAISRHAWLEAVNAQRGPAQWLAWARFWLLVYGASLALAGVLFFFAWNWPDMHRFEKFFLLEMALLGAVGVAAWRGLQTLTGEVALVAAAITTGVLMAVFGQTYQTGADAYELFRGWALLLLPWAAVAGSAALWLLWVVVAGVALLTFSGQALPREFHLLFLTLAGLLPALLLLVRDGLRLSGPQRAGRAWLPQGWFRPVFLAAALFPTCLAVIIVILDEVGSRALVWPSLLAGVLVIAAAYFTYRQVLRDMLALSLVIVAVAVMALFLGGKLVLDAPGSFNEGRLLLMALIILGVIGGAYQWLRFDAACLLSKRSKLAGGSADE